MLTVSDRGAPIPAEERERIFEPFRHGSRSGSGSGLGLALVRQIARRHGGEARWEAHPRGGNVFRVSLSRGTE